VELHQTLIFFLAVAMHSLEMVKLLGILGLEGMVLVAKPPLPVCTAFLGKYVTTADQQIEELHLEIGHAFFEKVESATNHQAQLLELVS